MPLAVFDAVLGDLPFPLGGGKAIAAPSSDVDVLIDRVPFWLAINKDSPYQRETAQFQRDQVDQQPEAGEQSLAGWWTRSQMSFHAGAGLDYLDTNARPDELDRVRFNDSRGVDVWTPGQVSRLNGCTAGRATPGGERVWLSTVLVGGVESTVLARPSAVEVRTGGTWTTATVSDLRAYTCDGGTLWWATPTGVFSAPVSAPGTATKVYNLDGSDKPMALAWVKQRLMFGYGPALYELTSRAAGTSLPATPRFTHPSTSWRWSVITDGPSGIIASGYDGLQSGMFKLELVTIADVPTLGPGIALLSMPGGERILSASYYLGSLLVVGTNRGVRVCPFESYYGTISLGPLSIETVAPVTAVAGYDRFVYAGTRIDGEGMLLRLDLGQPLDQGGHYAWACDLQASTAAAGDVTDVAFTAAGLAQFAVVGLGLQEETAGLASSRPSWLQTARSRMGTAEDKHWRYGLVRGAIDAANTVSVDVGSNLRPLTAAFVAGQSSERFSLNVGKAEWVNVRFTLTGTATLTSYQLQALPAGRRQRLISLPVSISDREQSLSGAVVGYDGFALERLALLEAIESAGAPVQVQVPSLFPDSVEAVIEKLTYVQTSAPADRGTGTAGVLQILVRTTA